MSTAVSESCAKHADPREHPEVPAVREGFYPCEPSAEALELLSAAAAAYAAEVALAPPPSCPR